ncbi:MAG TPA: hypothetical protein VGA77_01655 [Propylenella sp.]
MTIPGRRSGRLFFACLIGASFTALPTPSEAGIDQMPELGSICLHERVILRPKDNQDIDDAAVKEGIALVRDTICERWRSACFDAGEEVAMAQCRP